MAAETKTSVKAYFETGDKPTQVQFGILIDSYQDFDQGLTALTSATNAGTPPFIIKWETVSAASAVAIGAVGETVINAATTAAAQDSIALTAVTSAEANAGTSTDTKSWTPQLVWHAAIQAVPLRRNRLINPDGQINQRGTTSTADDAYGGPDRWYSLTQTGAISASQITDGENGTPFLNRITQSQASAQRMGRAQIIESRNSRDLRGSDVVLSGRIRCSVGQAIRYAILEHTGTADTVTSDVVNDWTSATYTTGNFFISADTTVVEVGSVTVTPTAWTDITAITGAVSSSVNNLIVFIWTEDTFAQNATLDFRLQLEKGTQPGAVEYFDGGFELEQCKRYFERLDFSSSTNEAIAQAYSNTTSQVIAVLNYTEKRTTPSLSSTNQDTFNVIYQNSNVDGATGSISFDSIGVKSCRINLTVVGTPLTVGEGALIRRDSTDTTFIDISAEL